MALVDTFGRKHDDLRVSVTDRCDLRCLYCMPEEPIWYERESILTYEELHRLIQLFVSEGVKKIRLTGGEPLIRKDLTKFIAGLAKLPIEDLSLTTNGVRLQTLAQELKDAGLDRINVSLDTLNREKFAKVTRRDRLERVLEGLKKAKEVGLGPIKINTVLVRGENDDEIPALVEAARQEGWELRFIEMMPLDNLGEWDRERVISGASVREQINALWPIEPVPPADSSAPAKRWIFKDGHGSLGFIDSVHAPFCADCSRLRLTSDGYFRNCLYDDQECDLKTPLRAGVSNDELLSMIQAHLKAKGRGGALDLLDGKREKSKRTMHQIGG